MCKEPLPYSLWKTSDVACLSFSRISVSLSSIVPSTIQPSHSRCRHDIWLHWDQHKGQRRNAVQGNIIQERTIPWHREHWLPGVWWTSTYFDKKITVFIFWCQCTSQNSFQWKDAVSEHQWLDWFLSNAILHEQWIPNDSAESQCVVTLKVFTLWGRDKWTTRKCKILACEYLASKPFSQVRSQK